MVEYDFEWKFGWTWFTRNMYVLVEIEIPKGQYLEVWWFMYEKGHGAHRNGLKWKWFIMDMV